MTDKLREAAQAIVDRWDSPAWGGSAENLRHTGEYIAELRAALEQQDAQAVPEGYKLVPVDRSYDMRAQALIAFNTCKGDRDDALQAAWEAMLNAAPTPPAQQDAQAIDHIPDAREMVSPTYGSEEVRKLRETIQSMARIIRDYEAAPTPAPKPLGWLDRKAVECLQGAELNWMPAWNRPTSSDPVPIFLSPTARATLTASEILNMMPESIPVEHDDALLEYARAVIEAYENKNGLKL